MPVPFTNDLTMWSPISLYENTTYFSNFYLDQPSGDVMNESLISTDLDPYIKFHQIYDDLTTSMNSKNNRNACYLCTATSANQRQLQASPSVVSLKSTAAAAAVIPFPLTWRHYQRNTKAVAQATSSSPPILNYSRDCQPPSKAAKMRLIDFTSSAISSPTHHHRAEHSHLYHHHHHHHHHQYPHYHYVPHYTITTPKPCSSSLFSHCTPTASSSCSCSFFQKCWVWWKSILQFKKKYIHPLHKRKS